MQPKESIGLFRICTPKRRREGAFGTLFPGGTLIASNGRRGPTLNERIPWDEGGSLGDANLKTALGYAKFKGVPRVLVLDAGYLVTADILEGAADLGWSALSIPTKGKGAAKGAFVGDLLKAVLLHRPDFIITVNHLGFDEGGALAELLAEYRIFTASWFVDHPMPVLGPAGNNSSDCVQVFCFERTALAWLSARGYENPKYLPTGANRRRFHPDRIRDDLKQQLACDLSFAGNSWWTKARIEPDKKLRKAAERAAKKIPSNRKSLQNGFESGLRKAVPGTRREQYAAAQVMLAEASMQRRRAFVRALQPVGIRIFGDPNWETMAPGVDLKPFLDNETSLPALFAGCSVNANVTAEQMPTALNQRVWDVPSVGGFLLTDDQADVFDFFEDGTDISVYRSLEEAADKVRYYLAHPKERLAIARRGLEKVSKHHTVTHRLRHMAEVMQQRYG